MLIPTPTDPTAPAPAWHDTPPPPPPTWYELTALEIEVGADVADRMAKLPAPTPGIHGPWHIVGSHLSTKPGARGQPSKTLVVGFARAVVADTSPPTPPRAAPPPRAPSPPPRAAAPLGGSRRVQPGPVTGTPARAPDVGRVIDSAIQGIGDAVERGVSGLLDSIGKPTSPPIAEGMSCSCAVPQPAVQNSAAPAVPCRGCGGWIRNVPADQPTA